MAAINAPIERLAEGRRSRGLWVIIIVVVIFLSIGLVIFVRYRPTNNGQLSHQISNEQKADQQVMGFVRNIQPAQQDLYIAVDAADWLTGPEALRLYQEDGHCDQATSSVCSLPSGYYLRNISTSTEPLIVSSDAIVKMQTLSSDQWDQRISLTTWAALFSSSTVRDWSRTPFIFSLIGGKVTTIREQVMP